MIKGFVLDGERLKLNKRFGKDYFNELLERIREIRASERRFYLKITDIYEQCSIDYDKHAELTKRFFKTVQNKLHWAVTGKTATEIIVERADAAKPTMGLTTWKNAPGGKIAKSDVSVAKNYLIEREVKELERIVTMYLDYAENQAVRQIHMRMADWVAKLDAVLKFNEYEAVADRLYWRVTDTDFERAASESTGEAVQYPVQLGSKSGAISSRRRCTKTQENTVKTGEKCETKLPGQDSNLD